jgi:putative intracellular protease/amidase/YHS domain-containing protein
MAGNLRNPVRRVAAVLLRANLQEESKMNKVNLTRRQLLQASGAFGLTAAVPLSLTPPRLAGAHQATDAHKSAEPAVALSPLKAPASGAIPVAFVISNGAVVIDFCGPWEVFQSASIPGRDMMDSSFELYTVAETLDPIRVSGGMKIVPNYNFQNAPQPKVIVIPAQDGSTDALLQWIRKASQQSDVTMSVCTGAFVFAATGLLNGKAATTHHTGYAELEMQYPDVRVKRGARFVEDGNLATAGGLTSGMDLALRVVGRYFGEEAIERTAFQLEYQGRGWADAKSNSIFAVKPAGDICAVCWMQVNRATAPSEVYEGHTYYFCMDDHKVVFDAKRDKFIEALSQS